MGTSLITGALSGNGQRGAGSQQPGTGAAGRFRGGRGGPWSAAGCRSGVFRAPWNPLVRCIHARLAAARQAWRAGARRPLAAAAGWPACTPQRMGAVVAMVPGKAFVQAPPLLLICYFGIAGVARASLGLGSP